MYFVYIVRTSKATLYTGITNNLKRRIHEHSHVKSRAAKYTWARRPVELVYSEEYSTITLAMKREREIKKMTRSNKLKLVELEKLEIRNYTTTDYNGVKRVLQEAQLFDETWDSPDNLAGMIKKDKSAVLVAVDGATVVGVVYLVPFGPKFLQLFRLAVKRIYRGRGIATKLIDRAQKIAKDRGVLEVGLFVESGKTDLRSFYRKRGFGGSDKKYVFMWKSIDKKIT